MTDRAQPGAIDSIIRNDELAQIFSQFSDGWIVPGSDPTPAAQRRGDIDETVLDAFTLSTSGSSLDVTVAPGEAFVGGWTCRDTSTTLTLPANTTSEIVVGWDPDAVYDPDTDADRDDADETIVDLAANVDPQYPTTVVHEVTTDGSGVTGASRVATVGPAIDANAVSADTLEATESITDPEGNTVTDFSDPVRVTEEASTFAESNVTTTLNSTTISSGSIELSGTPPETIIDDFEDGDITVKSSIWSGWNQDTSNLTAQSGTVIKGSFSGELTATGSDFIVRAKRDTADTINTIQLSTIIGSDTGNSNDKTTIGILGTSSGVISQVEFIDGTQNINAHGTDVGDWSAGTVYNVKFTNIDYTNENVDIVINGENQGTFNFLVSQSGLQYVFVVNDSGASGADRDVFIDTVGVGEGSAITSGDALIAFDSGVPADIDSWDLATFQRTLDGETVTVDVEDGNGNVLFSDIGPNFDISTIDTSKNVTLRFNLSRQDTSNNPRGEYAARRFTR